jgi:hypothetical protein
VEDIGEDAVGGLVDVGPEGGAYLLELGPEGDEVSDDVRSAGAGCALGDVAGCEVREGQRVRDAGQRRSGAGQARGSDAALPG